MLVQRVYQEHADMIKEEELLKQMSYFDLEVTISVSLFFAGGQNLAMLLKP